MDGMLTPPRALPRVRPDMMAKPLSGKYQGGWERCRGVGMATLSQLSAQVMVSGGAPTPLRPTLCAFGTNPFSLFLFWSFGSLRFFSGVCFESAVPPSHLP